MIRLALFLLPYAPRRLRPWLMGIALGRKPEQMEWREGKWRFPLTPEEERDQREFLDSFNRQVAELEANTAPTSTTAPSSSQPGGEASISPDRSR